MTREQAGDGDGFEVELGEKRGKIFADLRVGANVAGAVPLRANEEISCPGVKLHGSGFIVTREEAAQLGLGRTDGIERHIREYRNGRDLTARPRDVLVIDLFGLSAEEVRSRFPAVYQWVLERVKPERDENKRTSYRENWWIHGEPRGKFRPALAGLPRYIATVETSKHRFFQFLDKDILPDNMLVNVALDDAFHLGVLSSRIHVCWALAAGGRLGLGNDPRYNKTRCFETFPFPAATDGQQARIRDLAEQLDTHRKRQQAQHPDLTMTGMYNVLEKLRSGETLTTKEKVTHEQGLVSVLQQIHDDLDAAVFDAYGWAPTLTDEEILERLVALNAERAAEEARGHIRWLRPAFQCPAGSRQQSELAVNVQRSTPNPERSTAKPARRPWPSTLPEQMHVLRDALRQQPSPVSAADLARLFNRARPDRVEELLRTLVTLGQARATEEGRYVGG